MNILTSDYIYNNMFYYDIKSAGPTILKYITNNKIDLLNLEKTERNIKYGKLMKENEYYKIASKLMFSVNKFVCYLYDGIIYTPDSIITNRIIKDDKIIKSLVINYECKYHFNLLIINKNKNSYIAITNDNKVIIKGELKNYLNEFLVEKLIDFCLNKINWLEKFKQWFKNLNDNTYFLIQNKYLFIDDKKIEIENINLLQTYKVNKLIYWNSLLTLIHIIGLYQ
jgi:hypothetical protein